MPELREIDLQITSTSVFVFAEGDYFDQYYQKPYCRMGPYLVGMYTGFLLYRMKCKCNINKACIFLR